MPLHCKNSVQPVCPILELGQNFQEVNLLPHLRAAWTEVTSRQRRQNCVGFDGLYTVNKLLKYYRVCHVLHVSCVSIPTVP